MFVKITEIGGTTKSVSRISEWRTRKPVICSGRVGQRSIHILTDFLCHKIIRMRQF